jgi:fructose-1-phosphate kinase PfkB-like protein
VKRQKALDSLERRDVKTHEKFERKLNAVPVKMNKKHEKQLIREKKIRYRINKSVVVIPGSPPLGFEYYSQIINVMKKKLVPTLNFWNQTMNAFYDRTKYGLFYKNYKKLNRIPKKTKTA